MGTARRLAGMAADRLLLGVRRIPQFAIVGLPVPQRRVDVLLDSSDGTVDVTANNVAVSLEPFRIAIGMPEPAIRTGRSSPVTLTFNDRVSRCELARLSLRLERSVGSGPRRLAIFRSVAVEDACVGRLRRSLYYGWKRWTARRQSSPQSAFSDFAGLLSFYVCPRPVALVSVRDEEGRGNLFPMDLMGHTATPFFVAALKNTNRSIELVQRVRRMVVSRIPLALSDQAYGLAKQHRALHVDWQTIPLPLAKSPRFGFPVPASALSVTEIEIHQYEIMGSHTAFLGVPVHEHVMNQGVGMHHVSGLYQEHCRTRGRAL